MRKISCSVSVFLSHAAFPVTISLATLLVVTSATGYPARKSEWMRLSIDR